MFHWECDDCGLSHVKPEYGLPKEWDVLRPGTGVPLKHLCEACKRKYSKWNLLDQNGK